MSAESTQSVESITRVGTLGVFPYRFGYTVRGLSYRLPTR